MGSVSHIEDNKKELVRDVHRLARLGVRLVDSTKCGVVAHNDSESPLVVDVKAKQGTNKMYHYLQEIYWWNGIKKDIAEFSTKSADSQQVKFEHQKPGDLSQDISIPTWKWEESSMDFIVGLPRTRRQHDLILVIVDRMTKSAHFIPFKVSQSVEDYAKLYLKEMVPIEILDRQVKKLRNNEVASVKVLWRNQLVEDATWEVEADMITHYRHLFPSVLTQT
ncbi:hypothetical protein MTR67_012208 [Solanum verrucosum]|uniref:Uncharacterized protein n=1 Tax=Solanum verrucosum TaxID=315347 RepID=A0AAF0Q9A7_SOLVR|nr:hypothetical protein MTR67_012208 [Solanum verrucosum]